MIVSRQKKHEYWNHFIARWTIWKVGGAHGITALRLRRIQDEIFADDEFWIDIVVRHAGDDKTPEQMMVEDRACYEHCLGNFWGMIYQTMMEYRERMRT